jgi:hypothetical protein
MTDRTRRKHVAQGSRIAAAGAGLATMFGLVGAMGVAAQNDAVTTAPPAPAAVPTAQIVVVHRPAAAGVAADSVTPPASAPIPLTARPTVRPAAAAPVATSNGSR